MLGVYFSGTGNTKYCCKQFCDTYEEGSIVESIEHESIVDMIRQHEEIVFAYPIYWSNLPKLVNDFIKDNASIWNKKKIYIIVTMGLFSGDGSGCSARLFKQYGACIIGGLHLKMPDCIKDVKILKKNVHDNKILVQNATIQINNAVTKLKNNTPSRDGLGYIAQLIGLFGQRLWFYNKTKHYSDKLKINADHCIGCGMCIGLCPTKNLVLLNDKAQALDKCTKCYRCIAHCPRKAITLLGNKVVQQSKIEDYI